MTIENDEVYEVKIDEYFSIIYSKSMDKWAIETPDDGFTVDEKSFENPLEFNGNFLTLEEFQTFQEVIKLKVKQDD